jgi:hypothetical protein
LYRAIKAASFLASFTKSSTFGRGTHQVRPQNGLGNPTGAVTDEAAELCDRDRRRGVRRDRHVGMAWRRPTRLTIDRPRRRAVLGDQPEGLGCAPKLPFARHGAATTTRCSTPRPSRSPKTTLRRAGNKRRAQLNLARHLGQALAPVPGSSLVVRDSDDDEPLLSDGRDQIIGVKYWIFLDYVIANRRKVGETKFFEIYE